MMISEEELPEEWVPDETEFTFQQAAYTHVERCHTLMVEESSSPHPSYYNVYLLPCDYKDNPTPLNRICEEVSMEKAFEKVRDIIIEDA